MSRPIKFRAWDKERKEMRKVQLMDWSDWWVSTGSTWERENGLEYGERNSFENEETDRHMLMQYTGLKDRNGKEIYEGDKLLHPNKQIYEVEWRNLGWAIKDEIRGFIGWHPDVMEVIGNIYETPLEDTP